MIRYTLINRKKSTDAKNNREFVTWMRRKDMQSWESNKDFMDEYAHRKLLFEKISLRSDNEDVFVEDLQKNHLLKVEQFNKKVWGFLKK